MARVGAGGDGAFVSGKPDFTQRIATGCPVIPGAQIPVTPDADDEPRLDAKGGNCEGVAA